ncbi:hypothetical protein Tco_0169249 [Tanacetum coccineum]
MFVLGSLFLINKSNSPTVIEEDMRVGVDRTKYQIQISLPPKIDPSMTMMTVEIQLNLFSGQEASMKSGLAAKVKHIDGKLIGKDGNPLKVYRRGEGLDINQFKPGGVPCMLNEKSMRATDSCDSSHIQPKFDVYLLYGLGCSSLLLNAANIVDTAS